MMRSSSAGTPGFRRMGETAERAQNGVKNHAGSLAAEGRDARRHLVQHDAERKQIGASVEFLAAHLFRRHVGHGPIVLPGLVRCSGAKAWARSRRCRNRNGRRDSSILGQPEIQNLGVSASVTKIFAGLMSR